jgi:hypothetical protein
MDTSSFGDRVEWLALKLGGSDGSMTTEEQRKEFACIRKLVTEQVAREEEAVRQAKVFAEAKARDAAYAIISRAAAVKRTAMRVAARTSAVVDKYKEDLATNISAIKEQGLRITTTPESMMLAAASSTEALMIADADQAERKAIRSEEFLALCDTHNAPLPLLGGFVAVPLTKQTQREEKATRAMAHEDVDAPDVWYASVVVVAPGPSRSDAIPLPTTDELSANKARILKMYESGAVDAEGAVVVDAGSEYVDTLAEEFGLEAMGKRAAVARLEASRAAAAAIEARVREERRIAMAAAAAAVAAAAAAAEEKRCATAAAAAAAIAAKEEQKRAARRRLEEEAFAASGSLLGVRPCVVVATPVAAPVIPERDLVAQILAAIGTYLTAQRKVKCCWREERFCTMHGEEGR